MCNKQHRVGGSEELQKAEGHTHKNVCGMDTVRQRLTV